VTLQTDDAATAALLSQIGQELHHILSGCIACGLSNAHVPTGNQWLVALVIRILFAQALIAAQHVGLPREAALGTFLQLLNVIPLPPFQRMMHPVGQTPANQRN
jgi:hypothetical protein